ncbi:DUF1190 domain-containing protein [Methylobacterium sp. B4]|uniref:DUF1190 domain-containing protein n=1 Tax=Methylobacterium sp. B4 TaxID=1938755 RepID=UPI000D75114D|nr:DUF1190 domain-containing protein [Methylobacterium sp. B4]PXW64217.1 uncharacterized protein YgiB involved in biofilm formation [Methylobacterium sp. B4]
MADERAPSKRFGRRISGEPAPAVTPPDRGAIKRSQTVSTVLVAGAGLAALSLGSITRTAPSRDVLVYADPSACAAEGIRPAGECHNEYRIARAAYPGTAPHYDSQGACERHHGGSRCLDDATAAGSLRFVPRMAGYMIGRSAAQGVTPEPVYDHASGHGGHGGSYCTGSGTKVSTGSGGSASSGKVHGSSLGSKVSFGGFGSSGKGFSSFGGG